jgi:type IV pilus assembly protein PilE
MTRQRGFTLIEVMVVVVVMAILAALAYSSYTKQVSKGRRSDAYNLVGQLQLQLERWRAENPCYGQSAVSPCTTFTANGTYPDKTAAPYSTSKYYTIDIPSATTTSYSITATPKGAQVGDLCGTLTATGNAKPQWGTASCN